VAIDDRMKRAYFPSTRLSGGIYIYIINATPLLGTVVRATLDRVEAPCGVAMR
jgi:hypothetical protein